MPSSPPVAPRPVDARALERQRRRLRGAPAPWLHAEVARRMAERLSLVRLQPATVLDWHPGPGASGACLAAAYPKARRTEVVVDDEAGAPPATASSRWRLPWVRRADAAERLAAGAVAPGSASLVWSNMQLHAFVDPGATFAAWQQALAVDGFLMFSTLGPGTLERLSHLFAEAGWGPALAPLVDMHDLGDQLVQAGFADPVMDQEMLTLTWPDAAAALAELRTLGGNAATSRFAGLRTPRWRGRLEAALTATAGADGRVALAFEVVYGHAFKPPPRLAVAGETRVGVDELRAMARRPRTR